MRTGRWSLSFATQQFMSALCCADLHWHMSVLCTLGGIICHYAAKQLWVGSTFSWTHSIVQNILWRRHLEPKNVAGFSHGFCVSSCDLLHTRTDSNRRNFDVHYSFHLNEKKTDVLCKRIYPCILPSRNRFLFMLLSPR